MKCYVTRDKSSRLDIDVWRVKPRLTSHGVFLTDDPDPALLLVVTNASASDIAIRLGIPVPGPGECIEWELPEAEPAARELDPDEIPSVSLAITPGAVVRMRSGGPKMVVVHRNADSSVVGVTWFGDSHIKDARGVPSVALEVCDD